MVLFLKEIATILFFFLWRPLFTEKSSVVGPSHVSGSCLGGLSAGLFGRTLLRRCARHGTDGPLEKNVLRIAVEISLRPKLRSLPGCLLPPHRQSLLGPTGIPHVPRSYR